MANTDIDIQIKQMEELSDKLYRLGKQMCYENVTGSLPYIAGSQLRSLSDLIDSLTEGLNEELTRKEHNA